MSSNIELAIRALVFLVMTTVGLELRIQDLLRVREYPRLVPGIVVGHWIALVLTAGIVGRSLALSDEVRAGALLVAAAPAAALSCFYAQLADGQLALATTVTALSNALAALATPFVATAGFTLFLGSGGHFDIATAYIAQQALLGLLLPLVLGMAVGRILGDRGGRWKGAVRAVGLVAVASALASVVAEQIVAINAQIADLLQAALAFSLAALAVGVVVARIASTSASDRRALPWAFPARNVAVAALIASGMAGSSAMVSFIAVLFATQLVLLVPIALWVGSRARR